MHILEMFSDHRKRVEEQRHSVIEKHFRGMRMREIVLVVEVLF